MNVSTQHETHIETLGLTMAEAARRLGISDRRVRKICESGRLGYKLKVGGNPALWVITSEEVEKFAKIPRRVGRPRKIA